MRRRFWIRKCRIRRKADQTEQALHPLLAAVETATPPEGLLRQIERRIDDLSPKRRRFRQPKLRWLAVPITSSLVAGAIAAYGLLPLQPHRLLVDPTGMPVAQLETQGNVTTVRLAANPETSETGKTWFLWGLGVEQQPPVALGALAENGFEVRGFDGFAGFAMSLEDTGFAGKVPTGPVLVLTLEN